MAGPGYLPTERHGFTEPQPIPPFPPPPPPRRPAVTRREGAFAGGAAGIALVLGILIGRCSAPRATEQAPAAAGSAASSTLAVVSKPADGNVVLDGRFVGVSPIEHLSVEPGAHTVVVDVFGYQPYAGRLEVDPETNLKVSVTLVPVGGTGTTTAVAGNAVAAAGTAPGGTGATKAPVLTPVPVPKSALAPAAPAAGSGSAAGAPAPKRRTSYAPSYAPPSYDPPPTYTPPPRPKRDCGGEKSRCRDGCSRAENDCRFNCPNCVTCPSSVGSEMCRTQCESCRSSCQQNRNFCETSCDTGYDNCEASNRDY